MIKKVSSQFIILHPYRRFWREICCPSKQPDQVAQYNAIPINRTSFQHHSVARIFFEKKLDQNFVNGDMKLSCDKS